MYAPVRGMMERMGQGLREPQLDPEAMQISLAKQEDKHYQDTFRPLNQELIADTNSTAMVDSAKQNATGQYKDGLRRNERQRSRYGYNETALDKQHQQDTAAGAEGLTYDTLVNSARVDQYERNVGLRGDLMNLSRGIATSATEGMSTAANLQANREMNNDNIAAQNKASKYSFMGQAGGMMLTAATLAF